MVVAGPLARSIAQSCNHVPHLTRPQDRLSWTFAMTRWISMIPALDCYAGWRLPRRMMSVSTPGPGCPDHLARSISMLTIVVVARE
jgi:hypothetical protein